MKPDKIYMLLLEYPDGHLDILKSAVVDHGLNQRGLETEKHVVIAGESTVNELHKIGKRCLEENIINGYQILTPASEPVRRK